MPLFKKLGTTARGVSDAGKSGARGSGNVSPLLAESLGLAQSVETALCSATLILVANLGNVSAIETDSATGVLGLGAANLGSSTAVETSVNPNITLTLVESLGTSTAVETSVNPNITLSAVRPFTVAAIETDLASAPFGVARFDQLEFRSVPDVHDFIHDNWSIAETEEYKVPINFAQVTRRLH